MLYLWMDVAHLGAGSVSVTTVLLASRNELLFPDDDSHSDRGDISRRLVLDTTLWRFSLILKMKFKVNCVLK